MSNSADSLIADVPNHFVVGALLCQRYRVHEQLESIGPTLLYRVRDEQQQMGSVDRELSIKVLRPELRAQLQWNQQLKREFEQTRQLKHPHIMRMHSVNIHQGQPFIAMEPLRGRSLAVELQNRKEPLPEAQAREILTACCNALSFAHARGIMHADLRPENIFLLQSGDVRLMGFGSVPAHGRHFSMTEKEDEADYTSPQVVGAQRPDPRDDVFSLACIAHELLCGKPMQREISGARVRCIADPCLTTLQREVLEGAFAWRREDRPTDIRCLLDLLHFAAPAATLRGQTSMEEISAEPPAKRTHETAASQALDVESSQRPISPPSVNNPNAFAASEIEPITSTRSVVVELPTLASMQSRNTPIEVAASVHTAAANANPRHEIAIPSAKVFVPAAVASVNRVRAQPSTATRDSAGVSSIVRAVSTSIPRPNAASVAAAAKTATRATTRRRTVYGGIAAGLLLIIGTVAWRLSDTPHQTRSAANTAAISAGNVASTVGTNSQAPTLTTESTVKDFTLAKQENVEADKPAPAVAAPQHTAPVTVAAAPTAKVSEPQHKVAKTNAAKKRPSTKAEQRVAFVAPSVTVSARATVAALMLSRSDGRDGRLRVGWRIKDGTAVAGRDFTGPSSGSVEFAHLQTLRSLYIPLKPGAGQGVRKFTVELTSASNGVHIDTTEAVTVTIIEG